MDYRTRTTYGRLTGIALLAGILVSSLGAATMTLEQVTEYALTHNRSLAQMQLDIEKADAMVSEALSNYYPTLSLQGTYGYLSSVPVLNMQFGSSTIAIPLGAHANYDVKLALSQTLYAGGRIGKGHELARLNRELAEDTVGRSREKLVYEVRRSYTGVLLLKEMRKLTAEGQARAADHLKQVNELHNQGFVSSYDVLRTTVQVENLTPQIARIDNGIKLALEAVKLTIGMPLSEELDIAGRLAEPESLPPLDSAVAQALSARSELKLIEKSIKMLGLLRDITHAAYYPALGASVAYDMKKPASMGGSGWGPSLTVGVGLNYTLFDGMKTRAQLRQKDADIRKLAMVRDVARDGITLEVKEAYISMQTAQAAIAGARLSTRAAEEGVKLAETRYATGQGSNLDVLDSQLALFQAQTNIVTALKDYDDARARFLKAIGKE